MLVCLFMPRFMQVRKHAPSGGTVNIFEFANFLFNSAGRCVGSSMM